MVLCIFFHFAGCTRYQNKHAIDYLSDSISFYHAICSIALQSPYLRPRPLPLPTSAYYAADRMVVN